MESLPPEVITQILDYLSFEDRRQMALVNTVWNYASMHPTLLRKESFVFNEYALNSPDTRDFVETCSPVKYNEFMQTLVKSKREFFDVVFKFDCLSDHLGDMAVFTNLGVHLKCLYLDNIQWLSDAFFDSITTYCTSLESLYLKYILYLPVTDKTRTPLLSLNVLSLNVVGLTDKSFNIVMKCLPNVKNLEIFHCKMVVWHQAIKRFYPDYQNQVSPNFNSNNVFTEENFLRFLKTPNCINTLRLAEYPHILLQLPKEIKLHYFILDSVKTPRSVKDSKKYILPLIEHTLLQRLDIVCCSCCSLLSVISKLANLKHLTLKVSFARHDECNVNDATVIKQFFSSLICNKHIRTIEITFCENELLPIDWKNMFEFPDCVLKSLTTLNSPITNSLTLVNIGKNLTTLKIPNGEILTANDFKLLFKNLTSLRKLIINSCVMLNDDILVESPISNLKGLVYLCITGGTLSYQCFPYIKLTDLKFLHINTLSLGQCINKKDMTEFDNGLKEFGSYVPALTSLKLELSPRERLKAVEIGFDLLNFLSNCDKIMSYFKKLKSFSFDDKSLTV